MNNVSFQNSLTPFPFVDEPNSNIYYQMGVDVSNFRMIKNNIYRFNKKNVRNKDLISVCCDCLPINDLSASRCGEQCINRILFIECHGDTPCGENCGNRDLQNGNDLEFVVYQCGEKGVGLKCTSNIKKNQYVLEFVGEIIDNTQFNQRVQKYTSINMKHSYVMALRSKCYIDATQMGGVARFINHSCSPNLVSHKWSVGGYTRISFIAVNDIPAETELTFDYKFERFGEPLKCLCGGANCSGFMGKPAARKSIPHINKIKNSLVKNTECPEKSLKSVVEAPEVAPLRPRNPKTFVKYMVQLSDWSKRLKVVKYLKERCEPDFLKDLVNNKISFVLSSWLTHLDPIKCDIVHHKNLLVLFNLLPFEKRDDVPFDNLSHILDLWMRHSSARKVKGTDINIVEFGRLCRVVLNKINHLENTKKKHPETLNQVDNTMSSDVVVTVENSLNDSHQVTKNSTNFIVNNVINKQIVGKKESDKRIKFKHELSKYVVGCLKPYFNINDPKAIITNHDRFSSIAKNLTNILMNKELENAKNNLMQLEFDEETRKCVYHQIKRYLLNTKKN